MLRHWLLAIGKHSLHEPFIYDFYREVISNQSLHEDFSRIEALRNAYRQDRKKRDLNTLGALSQQGKRSFRQLAIGGSTNPSYARILYHITQFLNTENVIELGTSLGFTSLYLSSDPKVRLLTLEGDPILIKEAGKQFTAMQRQNIKLIEGNIDETLDPVLEELNRVDMMYIDANHRYDPTIRYFDQALKYIHEESVLIFDDIHWSVEMSQAWDKIRNDDRVTLSIDLYQFGIIFFKPFRQKYHYRIDKRG